MFWLIVDSCCLSAFAFPQHIQILSDKRYLFEFLTCRRGLAALQTEDGPIINVNLSWSLPKSAVWKEWVLLCAVCVLCFVVHVTLCLCLCALGELLKNFHLKGTVEIDERWWCLVDVSTGEHSKNHFVFMLVIWTSEFSQVAVSCCIYIVALSHGHTPSLAAVMLGPCICM